MLRFIWSFVLFSIHITASVWFYLYLWTHRFCLNDTCGAFYYVGLRCIEILIEPPASWLSLFVRWISTKPSAALSWVHIYIRRYIYIYMQTTVSTQYLKRHWIPLEKTMKTITLCSAIVSIYIQITISPPYLKRQWIPLEKTMKTDQYAIVYPSAFCHVAHQEVVIVPMNESDGSFWEKKALISIGL